MESHNVIVRFILIAVAGKWNVVIAVARNYFASLQSDRVTAITQIVARTHRGLRQSNIENDKRWAQHIRRRSEQ